MSVLFKVMLQVSLGLGCVVLGLLGGVQPTLAEGGPGSLWQSYLSGDGIPSGNILSIHAVQDGSLWFGTDAGASQYDGSWRSLTKGSGLPSDRVRAIAQTEDGALWYGTDAGLARRSPDGVCCGIWTTAQGLPDNDIHALVAGAQAPPGSNTPGVWVGTTKGVAYVDGERVVPDSPVPDASLQALATISGGDLLASVAERGVWRRGQEGTWQQLGGAPVAGGPLALLAGQDGRIWAGTGDGLVYYEDGVWRRFPLLADDRGLKVLAIFQDRDGSVWAGTERGAFHAVDAAAGGLPVAQYRAQRDGLISDHVRAIASDRDGGIWFGTIAGASRYAGNTWQAITDPALAGQRVNTVLVDRAGRTWAGTERNGLAVRDGDGWRRVTVGDGLPNNRIVSLFQDGAGRVWVSTGGGVGYFEASTPGQFVPVTGAGLVYSFEQDTNGSLWLAADDGIYRWRETAGLQSMAQLAGKRVNAVYQAVGGTLWAGTQADGLLRLASDGWQPVTDASSGKSLFNDIVVNGIEETDDGSLWVGTYNDGLWRYQDGLWERLDANLASPKILALSAAGRQLWLGTRQGLAGHDGRTWQTFSGDVLPDPGVLTLAPGEGDSLWIGTMGGLVYYQPEKSPPWVVIESINLTSLTAGEVTLSEDVLKAVRVAGGDLATRPEDLVFLTQLDGVDAASEAHDEALITAYSGQRLASGVHTLRVRARDSAFNYSAPVEARIIVPQFVTLPGGLRLRADVFFPILGLGALALAVMTLASVVSLRSRARTLQLTDQVAERQHEALERRFNPYISGEPVRHPDMFFGRDELVRRIFNALHQNSIMIYGERRMGKTTLLYQLADQLRQADDPEWAFLPVYLDLEGTSQDRFFYTLIEAIWGALQAYTLDNPPELHFTTMSPEEYTDREFSTDLRLILDSVKEVVAPHKARVILLLDEMDVVSNYDTVVQQQLRRVFMSPLAANIGAVVAGIKISKAWDRMESPWYNMFNEIPLEPFTDEQARQLLTEPVRGFYEWDPEAIEFVVQQAEGFPHRLQQYALEAVNQMSAAERLRITLEDVQVAHEIIERTKTI